MHKDQIISDEIKKTLINYHKFLKKCQKSTVDFSLSIKDDFISPFARCFWIFGINSIKQNFLLEQLKNDLVSSIILDLKKLRKKIGSEEKALKLKSYKQLLCFSLSALNLLDKSSLIELKDEVLEQCSVDIENFLNKFGTDTGKAGSGNHAMFLAKFLIVGNDNFNLNSDIKISKWINYHKEKINTQGFWGETKNLTHLQFQNGYHQYEIFHYLNIFTGYEKNIVSNLLKIADCNGQFAPYPGGGGCYDYDAIFLICSYAKNQADEKLKFLLLKTLNTIVLNQNSDGGFSENNWVRPISINKFIYGLKKCFQNASGYEIILERLKYLATLQRKKNNQIHTHWSENPRNWEESNLWDSWFRILTIAKISIFLDKKNKNLWNWLNTPGIGYSKW